MRSLVSLLRDRRRHEAGFFHDSVRHERDRWSFVESTQLEKTYNYAANDLYVNVFYRSRGTAHCDGERILREQSWLLPVHLEAAIENFVPSPRRGKAGRSEYRLQLIMAYPRAFAIRKRS